MIPEEDYRKIVDLMPIVCIDAIIVNENNEFLLIKRRNEPLKGEYWVPGGRLFKNEPLRKAAERKVREELGLNAGVLMPIGVYEDVFERNPLNVSSGLHTISIVYLVVVEKDSVVLDGQSEDWGWFGELPDRLKKMTSFNALEGLLK